MDRRKELEKMNVINELAPLAESYNLKVGKLKKSEIIDAIIAYEKQAPKDKEIKRRPPRNAAQTKLKALRVESGLTQKEVAERANIDIKIYCGYEQGVRNIDGAKLLTLIKICNVLGCELDDILEDRELITEFRYYKSIHPQIQYC